MENVKTLQDLPPPWDRIFPLVTRLFVWGLLFGAIYILRSFFLLVFLTFVFTYMQAHAVEKLAARISNRPVRVFLVTLTFLVLLTSIGTLLVPPIREQAELLGSKYHIYLQDIDEKVVRFAQSYPVFSGLLPEKKLPDQNGHEAWNAETSPAVYLFRQMLGMGESGDAMDIRPAVETVRNIGAQLLGISSAFLLSLLFSFLILLDLARLERAIRALALTKIGFMYIEVANGIRTFAMVLGRSLEAQVIIAILNSLLTSIGIYMLGLGSKVAFLSMIVFLCSFIPVAGVFISSVPICLLALQSGGVNHLLLAIGLITVVHMIEAYVLNPKIFGDHLHLNPVLVLIILTVGGKLFGVWGLVLGLPVCTYILGYAIRSTQERKAEGASTGVTS